MCEFPHSGASVVALPGFVRIPGLSVSNHDRGFIARTLSISQQLSILAVAIPVLTVLCGSSPSLR
jgi:hypothetical protein